MRSLVRSRDPCWLPLQALGSAGGLMDEVAVPTMAAAEVPPVSHSTRVLPLRVAAAVGLHLIGCRHLTLCVCSAQLPVDFFFSRASRTSLARPSSPLNHHVHPPSTFYIIGISRDDKGNVRGAPKPPPHVPPSPARVCSHANRSLPCAVWDGPALGRCGFRAPARARCGWWA